MSTTPVRCEVFGHKPIDIDPTGGAPWMGGPVAITVCDRCGRELPHSDTAKAFNAEVDRRREEREKREAEEKARAKAEAGSRRHWWSRSVR